MQSFLLLNQVQNKVPPNNNNNSSDNSNSNNSINNRNNSNSNSNDNLYCNSTTLNRGIKGTHIILWTFSHYEYLPLLYKNNTFFIFYFETYSQRISPKKNIFLSTVNFL